MRRAWAAVTALALTACAHGQRSSPPPVAGQKATASVAAGICSACGCRSSTEPHRQYCDARRRRYYYYDPAAKQYFWEDGTPK